MAVVSDLAVAIYGFKDKKKVVEEAGLAYEFNIIKNKLLLGLPTFPVYSKPASLNDTLLELEKIDDSDLSFLDNENSKYNLYVSQLDPSNSKKQDHYQVLGLSKLRYKATANQLKLAYRQKILKFHPDKGNIKNKNQKTEKIFACIQKAYEQLGTSIEKRRAYDSVDPTFDDSIPSANLITQENFFQILEPVFKRNARFSNIQPVPLLGDKSSSRSYVESFYDFWFNWSSWREFSYLDSEDKSKGEDKWERREIEKLNKAERERRRKKELKRISNLVDLAYEKDPRVFAFKDADRRQKELIKEQKKLEREKKRKEIEAQEEEENRLLEEQKKAELEREKQANQDKLKKKKLLTQQRKKLRELCTAAQYWTDDYNSQLKLMEQIERICLNAKTEEIKELCEKLANIKIYNEAYDSLKDCAKLDKDVKENGTKTIQNKNNVKQTFQTKWSQEELQILVKAVSLFPPGTAERWRIVTEYISNHTANSNNIKRTEKEVIKQVKLLSALDSSSINTIEKKETVILNNFNGSTFTNSNCIKNTTGINETKLNLNKNSSNNSDIWTSEQQKQLETALKNIPSSEPQRWDLIAKEVTNKTKKDCLKRYKYLAELVKQAKNNK